MVKAITFVTLLSKSVLQVFFNFFLKFVAFFMFIFFSFIFFISHTAWSIKTGRSFKVGGILINFDFFTCCNFEFIWIFTIALIGFLMFNLKFDRFCFGNWYLTLFPKAIVHVLIVIERWLIEIAAVFMLLFFLTTPLFTSNWIFSIVIRVVETLLTPGITV